MLIVQVCVGSSCYLKGSEEVVRLLESAIAEHHIEDEVVLSGSFCIGKCNRLGVTVQVNDDVHVGVATENFREFFEKNILDVIENERK
jgi:NADH:ubiquinone oxidoreductase subunit E